MSYDQLTTVFTKGAVVGKVTNYKRDKRLKEIDRQQKKDAKKNRKLNRTEPLEDVLESPGHVVDDPSNETEP